MKRINPVHVLITLSLTLMLLRMVILPEEFSATVAASVQGALSALGIFGYLGLIVGYALCGFFFVPLMIPLNILGGALYGAVAGTAVATAGITVSCIATTLSVRHVFTGMQHAIAARPRLERLIAGADRHRNLVIVMVRFAVVVPYLWQNVALAATKASLARLTLLTAISAIPGAAIYSLLGAGLVEAAELRQILIYIGLPVALMLALSGALIWLRSRRGAPDV